MTEEQKKRKRVFPEIKYSKKEKEFGKKLAEAMVESLRNIEEKESK